jgi:glycerol-3-phosphate dehydrogenase
VIKYGLRFLRCLLFDFLRKKTLKTEDNQENRDKSFVRDDQGLLSVAGGKSNGARRKRVAMESDAVF